MDVNGPYLNDLELGMNIVPTLQYGSSGFLTVWTLLSSSIQIIQVANISDVPKCMLFNVEQKILGSCKFKCSKIFEEDKS